MKVVIKTPLWTKILLNLGCLALMAGLGSHFFGFPNIPDKYMAFFLIGGVILMIPYQIKAIPELLKYRPKND